MARLPVHTRAASGSTDVGAVVGGVTSVFGRAGAVVAVAADYAASKVSNDSSTVSGTYVSNALDSLKSSITALVTGVSSVYGRAGAVVAVAGDYAASKISNDSSVVGTYVKDALNTIDAAYVRLAGDLGNVVGTPRVLKLNNVTLATSPANNQGFIYDGSQFALRGIDSRLWQWNGTDISQFDAGFDVIGAAAGAANTFASYTADSTLPRGGKIVMAAAAAGKKASVLNITQTITLPGRYRVDCLLNCAGGSVNRIPGLWYLGDGSTATTYSGFFAGIWGNSTNTSAYLRLDSGYANGTSSYLANGGSLVGASQQKYKVSYDLELKSDTWFVCGMRVQQSPANLNGGLGTHSDLMAYSASGGAIVTGTRTKLGIGIWHVAAIAVNTNSVEFLDLEVWRLP